MPLALMVLHLTTFNKLQTWLIQHQTKLNNKRDSFADKQQAACCFRVWNASSNNDTG